MLVRQRGNPPQGVQAVRRRRLGQPLKKIEFAIVVGETLVQLADGARAARVDSSLCRQSSAGLISA